MGTRRSVALLLLLSQPANPFSASLHTLLSSQRMLPHSLLSFLAPVHAPHPSTHIQSQACAFLTHNHIHKQTNKHAGRRRRRRGLQPLRDCHAARRRPPRSHRTSRPLPGPRLRQPTAGALPPAARKRRPRRPRARPLPPRPRRPPRQRRRRRRRRTPAPWLARQ